MDMYLINLCGINDEYFALVDKEIFDWITSPYKVDETHRDLSLPESLRKRMWDTLQEIAKKYPMVLQEYEGYDDFYVYVTSGSYDNDRALFVSNCNPCNNEELETFFSNKELIQYVKKHDINIVDEYNGGVY